jgi:hypothetical protein
MCDSMHEVKRTESNALPRTLHGRWYSKERVCMQNATPFGSQGRLCMLCKDILEYCKAARHARTDQNSSSGFF